MQKQNHPYFSFLFLWWNDDMMRHMTQYIWFHQLRIQVSFKIQRFEMMQFSPMFTQEPAMGFFSANEAWLPFWQLPDSAASNMISSSTVLRQPQFDIDSFVLSTCIPSRNIPRGVSGHTMTSPNQCGLKHQAYVSSTNHALGTHSHIVTNGHWKKSNVPLAGNKSWLHRFLNNDSPSVLQQMDFYHRHVTLLIELEDPINACCQHVSTMSMMLEYCTTSVQRITERACSLTFPLLPQHTYSSAQLHGDSLFLLHLFAHFSPSKCLMSPLCLPAMFPPCTSCMRVLRHNFRRWSHVCLRHQRIRGYKRNSWPSKKSHKKGPSKKSQL